MPTPARALIEPENGTPINCMFNPAQLTITKTNSWASQPVVGRNAPDLTFTSGRAGAYNLDLVLDTTNDGSSVTAHTSMLQKCMEIDPELKDRSKNTGRPPYITFRWGTLTSFKSVITSLTISFTYFSQQGTPLRAKVKMRLEQFEESSKWGGQNPTSGTPNPARAHRFAAGETLSGIAYQYYRDPAMWRFIATTNHIRNPQTVAPGSILLLPEHRTPDDA